MTTENNSGELGNSGGLSDQSAANEQFANINNRFKSMEDTLSSIMSLLQIGIKPVAETPVTE